MKESILYQKIFDIIDNSKIAADINNPNLKLKRPHFSANAQKELPENLCGQILKYFSSEVIPFAVMLKEYSEALSNTLNFDLNIIYSKVESGSEELSKNGNILMLDLPKTVVQNIKDIFRHVMWPWIKDSYFVSTGLLKPKGFPGDYIIVESMYDGNAKTMEMGYVYDTIFLNSQLCQGLRNRKDQMKQIIKNYLNNNKGKRLNILNVGCGGSRELRELPIQNMGEGLTIYLMDFDTDATSFSIRHIRPNAAKADLIPLNVDVRDLGDKNKSDKFQINKCDLVYSIGLFDYLSDKIIISLLNKLLSIMKDNALLVVAHKDFKHYDPAVSDWFCDWKYFPRTQPDFEGLINKLDIKPRSVSFAREKDGYIYFAEILK